MTRQAPDQIPWDPQSTVFPTRTELPTIPGAPDQAAWVWGDDDYVRTTPFHVCSYPAN